MEVFGFASLSLERWHRESDAAIRPEAVTFLIAAQ